MDALPSDVIKSYGWKNTGSSDQAYQGLLLPGASAQQPKDNLNDTEHMVCQVFGYQVSA
jgi:hypothetical protein